MNTQQPRPKKSSLTWTASGLLLLSSVVWQACGNATMPLDEAILRKSASGANGIGQSGSSASLTFSTTVAPLFKKRCFNCHGAGKMNAADWQDLNTVKLKKDKLIDYVVRGYMPLGGPKLPDDELLTIQNWIKAGMPDAAAPAPDMPAPVMPSPVAPSPVASPSESPAPPDPAPSPVGTPTFEGKILGIFKTRCGMCHGAGKMNPNDWTDYETAKLKKDKIRKRISEGSMPLGGGLPEEDRAAILAWIDANVPKNSAELPTQPAPEPSVAPQPVPEVSAVPIPEVPTGPDFETSVRPVFESKCKDCHHDNAAKPHLMTAEGALLYRDQIRDTINLTSGTRMMPPINWAPLTDLERSTILSWLDANQGK